MLPTATTILVAGTVVDGVQEPPASTAPKRTDAVAEDRSVPKFTVACRPTRSVRYGARVR